MDPTIDWRRPLAQHLFGLPTGRSRPTTIAAMGKEAADAAGNVGVEVRPLIPDSSDGTTFTDHAKTPGGDRLLPHVVLDAAPIGVGDSRRVVNSLEQRPSSGDCRVPHRLRLTSPPLSIRRSSTKQAAWSTVARRTDRSR
ncbi:DUF6271 family protein [Kitasatospora sp. NPDC003701]